MDLSELYQPVEEDDKGRKISQDLYSAIEVNSDFDLSCMYIATHNKVRNGLSAVSNNLQAFAYNFYPQQFDNPIVGWCFGRKTHGALNYWMDMTFGKGEFDRPKFGNSGNTPVRIVSDININEYALRSISMYCYDPDNIGSDLRPVGIGNKDFAYLLENPDKLCRAGGLGLMYKFSDQSSENLQPTMMINGKVTGFVSPYSLFCTNSKYGVQCNYVTGAQNGGWSDSDSNYANDTAWVNYDTPDRFLEAVPIGLTYNLQDSGRLENGEIVFENDVCVAYYRKDFTYRCDAIEWYYKVSWVLEVIASMGVYVQTTNTKYNSLDDLIESGNCYLGEMDSNGVATGRFLHERADIEKAFNYNINTNNSPVDPYSGGGGGDDYDDDPSDDIDFGYIFEGSGSFTNLWYCTSSDLTNLRRYFLGLDLEHTIPEGFDPMTQIIGLYQFPIALGGDTLDEITFRTQANVIVHSGVSASRGLSSDLLFDLGSIDIPKRMKERGIPFLDYESLVEVYVPFCGVFQLDTQTVIGKTLSVKLWMSPTTGECNCIIYTTSDGIKAPVAYGSGNMCSQIPISSNGWGAYSAALKEATIKKDTVLLDTVAGGIAGTAGQAASLSNILSIGEEIAGGQAIGGVFGAVGLALGGAAAATGLISTGIQTALNVQNTNVGINHLKQKSGTTVSGSFSGTSAWHYPFRAYVKITRPRYKKPTNYAHTQGIPLVKEMKLGSCHGFTICINTDLSGVTATQTERDLIASCLSSGVIV